MYDASNQTVDYMKMPWVWLAVSTPTVERLHILFPVVIDACFSLPSMKWEPLETQSYFYIILLATTLQTACRRFVLRMTFIRDAWSLLHGMTGVCPRADTLKGHRNSDRYQRTCARTQQAFSIPGAHSDTKLLGARYEAQWYLNTYWRLSNVLSFEDTLWRFHNN